MATRQVGSREYLQTSLLCREGAFADSVVSGGERLCKESLQLSWLSQERFERGHIQILWLPGGWSRIFSDFVAAEQVASAKYLQISLPLRGGVFVDFEVAGGGVQTHLEVLWLSVG